MLRPGESQSPFGSFRSSPTTFSVNTLKVMGRLNRLSARSGLRRLPRKTDSACWRGLNRLSARSGLRRRGRNQKPPRPLLVSIAFRLVPVFAVDGNAGFEAARILSQSPFGSFRSSPFAENRRWSRWFLGLNRLSARSGLRRKRARQISPQYTPQSQSPFGSFRSSPIISPSRSMYRMKRGSLNRLSARSGLRRQ